MIEIPDELKYPFSGLDDYRDDLYEQIIGQPKYEIGNFPYNIIEYIWIHEGENNEESWETLCRLDDGNFAYYIANCDYTGFDCQGNMSLYISHDLHILYDLGMTRRSYDLYLKESSLIYERKEHELKWRYVNAEIECRPETGIMWNNFIKLL